jgi:hypothetical protein
VSHYTVYITSIAGLTEEMLVQAIEFFAKQFPGAQLYYGKIPFSYGEEQKVIIGMRIPPMREAIGFNIVDGKLAVCGDNYSNPDFERFKAMAESGQITNCFLIAQQACQEQAMIAMRLDGDRIVLEVEVNG